MWQRAKLLRPAQHAGRIVWLLAAAPEIKKVVGVFSRKPDVGPRYRMNIVVNNPRGALIRPEWVELLPEFAEDVPLISWDDFLAGKEQ